MPAGDELRKARGFGTLLRTLPPQFEFATWPAFSIRRRKITQEKMCGILSGWER